MSDLGGAIGDVIEETREREAEKDELHNRIADRLGEGYEDASEPDASEADASGSEASGAKASGADASEADASEADPWEQSDDAQPAYSGAEIQAAYQQWQQQAANLQQQYNAVDWTRLRQQDPAQYATLQNEFQQYDQALTQQRDQIVGAVRQVQSTHLNKEKKKLLKAVPEWKDEKVATREKTELREFLKGKGYSDEEISAFSSARDIVSARDWMMSERKAKTQKTLKRPKQPKRPTGLLADVEKMMERNAKQKPGGSDDIQLRLIRGGFV